MTKAETYRKRAGAMTKGVRKRVASARPAMLRKQAALTDMADNEDWLDGKPNSEPKPEKRSDDAPAPRPHRRSIGIAERPPRTFVGIDIKTFVLA